MTGSNAEMEGGDKRQAGRCTEASGRKVQGHDEGKEWMCVRQVARVVLQSPVEQKGR